MNSFWSVAKKLPPCLVRLLARHKNGPPLTTREIVERSQGLLDSYQVSVISQAISWDYIPFGQMRAFLLACDVDFCDRTEMNRKLVYLKIQHKFAYLRKSPEWETVLKPLAIQFREQCNQQRQSKASRSTQTLA